MTEAPAAYSQPAVCIYATPDGESVLLDLSLPVTRKVERADGSSEWLGIAGATGWGIVGPSGDAAADERSHSRWHTSGPPGLSIVLSGAWQIEAGNGDTRVLDTGAVLVMLDNHGRGHRSRTLRQPCATIGVSFDAPTAQTIRELAETTYREVSTHG
jgi:hypothetical protein